MKKVIMVVAFAILALSYVSADVSFSMEPGFKYIYGKSYERSNGSDDSTGEQYTLSELAWDVRNIIMAGGDFRLGVIFLFLILVIPIINTIEKIGRNLKRCNREKNHRKAMSLLSEESKARKSKECFETGEGVIVTPVGPKKN